ncbi:hypothetical protein TTHERM_01122680 (macronuclear) [Tetrahymena thermophila SB210]|uniref:Nucleoporin n=1 Tax=Tetrahymena thermophila (strain SB210) TaxID=312017 RepID=Q23S21_TETTS|nr:hypothetical protein TTHERM_01122680 [Tetrahymena thermophila SB210]EAR99326.2 hypothetical protein TTHERM_01122680 [Tetrahymena thermophila SB210]|eukprot:XP_001019571.2 hypothetical protein TTHERM_01122680 [Tetrahymena thermophila SB210]
MFNQQQGQANGGGLFGGAQNKTTNPVLGGGQGGGLFTGATANQPTIGTGATTGAAAGGGIFQNKTNTPSTSLFNGGATGTGLTIGQNQQAPTNTNPTNPPTVGGGLFAQNNQNPSTAGNQTGIFGNKTNILNPGATGTTATTTTGTLLGNPSTTAATTTAVTGTNAQPGQQNNAQQPANNIDVSLTNEKLNPLVQKWKRKIQSQSENLLQIYTSLGESLTQIEQCSKYYENLAQISQGLNGQFDQINVEVKNIEQYQTQIESHLDIIRSKLIKQLELQGDSESNAFKQPIGEKIQAIDFGLAQIEKNVNQLIDEINPQKEQTQDSKKTIQESLNSYYQILEKLEYDTINLQFKLQSVAEKVADQI